VVAAAVALGAFVITGWLQNAPQIENAAVTSGGLLLH
jgi:hypothetical protein